MPDVAEILLTRRLILLDFDGPVCAAFGPPGGAPVASALRTFAQSRGLDPTTAARPTDPLSVLRAIADERPDLTDEADAELRRLERLTIQSATPTAGADEFLHSASKTGRTVAIVSNNSTDAIRDYLAAHQLSRLVGAVVGRPIGDPKKMKPSSWLLEEAAARTRCAFEQAVMIGDSVSDVYASQALGIPCVGYANKAGKHDRLLNAGADAVVDSMGVLSALLESDAST